MHDAVRHFELMVRVGSRLHIDTHIHRDINASIYLH